MMKYKKLFARYYVAVRPQINELHTIHKEGCPFMPEHHNRVYLGIFRSEEDAGRAGNRYFLRSSGCRFCTMNSDIKSELEKSEPAMVNIDNQVYLPTERQLSNCINQTPFYTMN